MQTDQPSNTVAHMLDVVLQKYNLKNDAALCRAIEITPPTISKIRNGVQPLGFMLLVKLHEFTGMSTKEIKVLAGIE
jgi:hypothetical protein